uniref:BTB/POZ domain-containing protein At3g44820 n=1 Tax=Anthurium amnicola TaxID=1678845 RepID=A0A1D1Y7S6_9ARAE
MEEATSAAADTPTAAHVDERVCRFYRQGNAWFFETGLPSDIIIEVDAAIFHLHKFPLLSRCRKIVHLLETSETRGNVTYIHLMDCPGGSDAFLVVAKFCYGVRVEMTAKNILMVYCAADYFEMTKDYGEDNLLVKAETFFCKVILRNWKDCILALQSSDLTTSQGETLQIVSKSLNALSMMACTDPSLFGWPLMMYGNLQSPGGSILWNGINTGARIRSAVSDWWFEDVSCLSVPMFKRLMETMKERGIRPENIAGAVMHYARKYLPGLSRWLAGHGRISVASLSMVPDDQKVLLESIEKLLPEKKGKSFCRFLLGLLRIAMILNVCQSCKYSLQKRIGMQLELATLEGLMIPSFSDSDNLYDTDCIERIIEHFVSSEASNVTAFSPLSFDPSMTPSSSPLTRVSKLVDSYLAEVAPDVNLKPEKMRALAEAFPASLRSLNDGLYRALDIYFKAHPWLSMNEREQLLSIIDYRRLSFDACTHASQNERLPLRVALQVLFFEQLHLKKALSSFLRIADTDSNATGSTEDMAGQIIQIGGWVSLVRENRTMKVDMDRMMLRVRELEQEIVNMRQEMKKVDRLHCLINSTHTVPRKFGCMPLPHLNDPKSDSEASIIPSSRKSFRATVS